jgi:predicted NBD/HSP70 family sugar kinase
VDEFVYLHIGTGVGLGIVVHGEVYRGAGGAAGEVGYLPLWGTDVGAPASRKRGALDRAASAGGVVEAARRAGMAGPLTGERIFAAAANGDRVAKKVVAQEADRIAMTIAAVAAVLDPALVILGGGIGANADLLLDPVRDRVRELSPFRPAIEASGLREEATLYGSVSMALQAAHARLFDRSATA